MTQLRELSVGLLNQLKVLIEEFQENPDKFSKQKAKQFQTILIVLCFCFLGGQRKQVIVGITIKVNSILINILEICQNSRRRIYHGSTK